VVDNVPQIPLIVDNAIEELTRAKEVEQTLASLGVIQDIARVRDSRKIRAGKGKHRGRKMKQAIGPLIVVVENKGLVNAANNVPGVEVTTVANLNTEMLAPGTHPGRLTLWTNGAVETLNKLYGKGENA
jgi:large subunit ribosomal protein L4e